MHYNSVFSRKLNYILLTILKQLTFETKSSLNILGLKSVVLAYVWKIANVKKLGKAIQGISLDCPV